jgi:hypothetical protein
MSAHQQAASCTQRKAINHTAVSQRVGGLSLREAAAAAAVATAVATAACGGSLPKDANIMASELYVMALSRLVAMALNTLSASLACTLQ